jgi:hypothetical protein
VGLLNEHRERNANIYSPVKVFKVGRKREQKGNMG